MRLLAVLLMTSLAGSAGALTLTPLTDGRDVFVQPCGQCSGTQLTPATPFQTWTASLPGASQTSSLDPLGMSGNGSATGTAELYNYADSLFIITFSIDAPAGFELSGIIAAELDGAEGSALIRRADNSIVVESGAGFGETVPFDLQGYLDPGTYTIRVVAVSGGTGTATMNFLFNVVPAPEPELFWLAALALAPFARPLRALSRLRRRVAQHA